MNLLAIVLAYISLFYLGLSDNVRGPLYPEILNEFSLTNSLGSFFFSVASGAGFVGSFIARFVLNKLGTGRTLAFAVFLMALSQLLMSISGNFSLIVMISILFGIAIGIMGVVQNILVIEGSPPDKVQRFQSGLHSNYGLASLLAPLLVAVVAHFNGNWRETFIACSIMGVLLSLYIFMQRNKKGLFVPEVKASTAVSVSHIEMIYFASILAAYVGCEIMVSTRIALYVRSHWNVGLEGSSYYTSAFFVFLLVGRMLFIFWQPKVSLGMQMLSSLIGSIVLVGGGLLLHPLFLVLSGLAMAPFYPLAMTAMGKLFPRSLNSAASTTMALISVFVVIMHYGVGVVTDGAGIRTALWIGPQFCALAVALVFLYPIFFKKRFP